ncbi:hypothetical protein C8R47DRAFT_1083229 [Mycena vitilis]|nr:hypothetical protein C8R47DRAFT_1083229 [Mycena vitilis]
MAGGWGTGGSASPPPEPSRPPSVIPWGDGGWGAEWKRDESWGSWGVSEAAPANSVIEDIDDDDWSKGGRGWGDTAAEWGSRSTQEIQTIIYTHRQFNHQSSSLPSSSSSSLSNSGSEKYCRALGRATVFLPMAALRLTAARRARCAICSPQLHFRRGMNDKGAAVVVNYAPLPVFSLGFSMPLQALLALCAIFPRTQACHPHPRLLATIVKIADVV